MDVISNREFFCMEDEISLRLNNVSGFIEHFLVTMGVAFEEVNDVVKTEKFYIPHFRNMEGGTHRNIGHLTRLYNESMYRFYDEYNSYVEKGIELRTASYILPLAIKKDLVIRCNKKQLINLVFSSFSSKYSEIPEMTEFGEKLKEQAREYCPSLDVQLDNLHKSNELFDEINGIYSNLRYRHDRSRLDGVNMFSEGVLSVDFKICVFYLMQEYGLDWNTAYHNATRFLHESSISRKGIEEIIINSGETNILGMLNYQLEFPASLQALRELARNGLRDNCVGSMASWEINEYYVPKQLEGYRYLEVIKSNEEIYNYFLKQGVKKEDLLYMFFKGNVVNSFVNINGKDLLSLCNFGACEFTLEEVKSIINHMALLTKKGGSLISSYFGPTCETIGRCYSDGEKCSRGTSLVLKDGDSGQSFKQ